MLELIKICILKWLMSGIEEEADCDCEYWDEEEDNQHPCMDISPISNESIENWTPPARYCVFTGGNEIWCDQVKSGLMSIDLLWTQKIGGVEKPVCASLSETSYIIYDYETTLTSKAFDPDMSDK